MNIRKIIREILTQNVDILNEASGLSSKKVIFLDIDGVLIPYKSYSSIDHADFNDKTKWNKRAVDNINKLVKKTGAKIVISSYYRNTKTLTQIKNKFKQVGIRAEVIGVTDTIKNKGRGDEIERYVNDKGIKKFVVIDDLKHNFSKLFPSKVVKVQPGIGFDEANLNKALKILR